MINSLIYRLISLLFLCLLGNNYIIGQCNSAIYSTNPKDSWLSCQPSENPNNNQGESHWLQYDLGYIYDLGTTKFWNYNVVNQTGQGFKEIAVDFSFDGINWIEGGVFQLPEATGQTDYDGVEGVNLSGLSARYILITALSTWEEDGCAGLGQVKIELTQLNTLCGDYDVTEPIGADLIKTGVYYGNNPIVANGKVQPDAKVSFKSPTSITLKNGFIAEFGSQFLATIGYCEEPNPSSGNPNQDRSSGALQKKQNLTAMKIFPNPATLILNLDFKGNIVTDLMVINSTGHEILRRNGRQIFNKIDVSQLPAGMYFISMLTTEKQLITQRFIKVSE